MAARSCSLATGLFLSACTFSFGQAGDLDSTFNGMGMVLTGMDALALYGDDVAVQADGRIIVFGSVYQQGLAQRDLVLARYMPDGSPDPSFGTGGLVFSSTWDFTGHPVRGCILPDGRILAAGTGDAGGNVFRVSRFMPDGALDASFGDGGVAEADISADVQFGENVRALCIQPDGRAVLGGTSSSWNGDMALVRFNMDGTLDGTFGTDGIATVPASTLHDQVSALSILDNGDLLAAGWGNFGTQQDNVSRFVLAKLTPDGGLDTAFGTDGIATFQIGQGHALALAAAVDGAGRFVAAGFNGYPALMTVIRCSPDGALDPAFGDEGIVSVLVGSDATKAEAVRIQPDGKILIVADAYDGSGTLYRPVLFRFLDDGSPDAGFGDNGIVQTAIPDMSAIPAGMDLQPDGRIVVGGYAFAPGYPANMLVVRYRNDLVIGMDELPPPHVQLDAFPNPVHDRFLLRYRLDQGTRVSLELRDAHGRCARVLRTGEFHAAGPYSETIDMSGLAPGLYAVCLTTPAAHAQLRVLKR